LVVVPIGDSLKLIGKGLNTSRVYEPILNSEQIAALETSAESCAFNGDAQRFRLRIEALRLGLAFEYDPYFALSIARVDPLPHQLEAVYDYFLKLARIRFLLADRSGCAKLRSFNRRTSDADSISLPSALKYAKKWRVGRVPQSDCSISGCGSAWYSAWFGKSFRRFWRLRWLLS